MRHSISRKFTRIFILLMAGTILLCWFLNISFLEKYYIHDKQNALLHAYRMINKAIEEEIIDTEEFGLELQGLSARYNMDILILDADSRTLRYAGGDPETAKLQLWDNLFLRERNNWDQSGDKRVKTLVEENNYRIEIVSDRVLKNENVEMWGNLDNGNFFIIRTALESIRDSVRIANRFLA